MHNVYWMLELSIKEGKLEPFKALMNEMVTATQADEPDALNYEWWISPDQSSCHIYERYADVDAAMVHMGNFGSKFAERFMPMVEPTGFKIYGKVNDTFREAMKDMGPVYFDQLGGFTR